MTNRKRLNRALLRLQKKICCPFLRGVNFTDSLPVRSWILTKTSSRPFNGQRTIIVAKIAFQLSVGNFAGAAGI